MKIVVGYRHAKSRRKSQCPVWAKVPMTSTHRSRTRSSSFSIAFGAKCGASSWRHAVCSGGSSISGIHLYGGSGSWTVTTELENVSGCCSASRITSAPVITQKPSPNVLRTKGCSSRSASISSAWDSTGPVVPLLNSRSGYGH